MGPVQRHPRPVCRKGCRDESRNGVVLGYSHVLGGYDKSCSMLHALYSPAQSLVSMYIFALGLQDASYCQKLPVVVYSSGN